MNIRQGIYKHYKGNFYFVFGVAWDREDPTNAEKAEVIYHPLYHVQNFGWRRGISPKTFLEHVTKDVDGIPYCGPRFWFFQDWSIARLDWVLPGGTYSDYTGGPYTVEKVYERDVPGSPCPRLWVRCSFERSSDEKGLFDVPLDGTYHIQKENTEVNTA